MCHVCNLLNIDQICKSMEYTIETVESRKYDLYEKLVFQEICTVTLFSNVSLYDAENIKTTAPVLYIVNRLSVFSAIHKFIFIK